MSNNLDPDQTRRFVGPDLDPNCLQRLSADNTSRQGYSENFFLTNSSKQVKIFKLQYNIVTKSVTYCLFLRFKGQN